MWREVTFIKIGWLGNMMTSSNGKFSALLALCAGTLPVTGELPTQRPVTRSFDVFVELCVNKQLSKQPCGWCFQTPVSSLWRHCNACSATYWLLYKASLPETNVKKTSFDINRCWNGSRPSAKLAWVFFAMADTWMKPDAWYYKLVAWTRNMFKTSECHIEHNCLETFFTRYTLNLIKKRKQRG